MCRIPGPAGPRIAEETPSQVIVDPFDGTSALNRAAQHDFGGRQIPQRVFRGVQVTRRKGKVFPVFADCAATQVDFLNSARGGPRVPRKFAAATPLSRLAHCRWCRPRPPGCSFHVFVCRKGCGMRRTRFECNRDVTLFSGAASLPELAEKSSIRTEKAVITYPSLEEKQQFLCRVFFLNDRQHLRNHSKLFLQTEYTWNFSRC